MKIKDLKPNEIRTLIYENGSIDVINSENEIIITIKTTNEQRFEITEDNKTRYVPFGYIMKNIRTKWYEYDFKIGENI